MISFKPKILQVRDPETGEFITLIAIKGDKGVPGSIDNIGDYLTSETGDSEELAMTQKGVTDIANELSNSLEDLSDVIHGGGTIGLKYSFQDGFFVVNGLGTATDTDIVIPSTICNIPVQQIESTAFKDCENLTSVTISDNVTRIGNEAFYGCTKLTSVTIGNNITNIGYWAFFGCSSLKSVVIPASVTHIGIGAFVNCTNLTDIYYKGTEEEWNAISMEDGDVPTNATIHYNYTEEET